MKHKGTITTHKKYPTHKTSTTHKTPTTHKTSNTNKIRVKKNLKRRSIKKMNCSPFVRGKTVSNDTCYTNTILLQIKDAYNKNPQHLNTRINSNDPLIILDELKDRLSGVCNKEDCWLSLLSKEQQTVLDKTVFAPDKPTEWNKNPNEWLSNYDILNVLKQYEEKHPEFKFIGPTPIDFDSRPTGSKSCVWNDLCTFSLDSYIKRNVTQIGIIFNLDKHNESGSHWVSLFINIPNKTIFYFDSAANKTPKEIKTFVKRVQTQGGGGWNGKGGYRYLENYPNQHQKSDTECGMYSLYFIITMIDNTIPFEKRLKMFKSQKISDKQMENLRDVYFNDK
jgi:hypothetical protein